MDEDNFLNGDIAHVRQSLYREVELVAETTIESLQYCSQKIWTNQIEYYKWKECHRPEVW
jgi:hypothetical protein